MMHMDDSDPDEVQTPLDGPTGMQVKVKPPLPADVAAEDWVPPQPEPADDPLDEPEPAQETQDGLGDGLDQDKPADAPAPPRRGRGRPRKPVEEKLETLPERPRSKADEVRTGVGRGLHPFPKPDAYFFKPENVGEARRPPAFFTYLAKIAADKEFASRFIVYVYRNWPVMIPEAKQQDKLAEPISYTDLERRYGMGDYHLKLNDAAIGKTICMVNAHGFRNEEYPAVLDAMQVDTSDPLNKSWIARQRSKGVRFDGDAGDSEKNEESSMAEIQAMNTLAGSLDKATTKLIDMASKEKAAPAQQPSMDQEAVSKGLDIVAQAATMGNKMMETAINRLTERTGAGPDPLEMMERSFTMAKDFLAASKGDGQQMIQANDHSQIIEIMKMQQEQQRQFHDTLFNMQQSQINKLELALEQRNASQSVSMEVANRPKTLIEQINEMKEAKEAFREVLGITEDEGGKQSWLAENGPMLIQGLSVLGSVISTGLYNLAVIKSGQGVPAQPPGPEMVLSPEQQANLREHGIPVGGQPQPASPASQQFASQNQQPASTMEGEDMLTQYHRFLHMIQPSLLKAFQEGVSGDEYADTMITLGDNAYFGPQLNGQQVYSMVKENGKPAIMALIKTYPEIWNVVKLTPIKWEEFMTDFFRAEEIWAEAAKESESEGEGVAG